MNLLQNSSIHTGRAMVRKAEQAETFAKMGIATAIADLKVSVDNIARSIKDSDAIVFTAGSGGHTGPDQTWKRR